MTAGSGIVVGLDPSLVSTGVARLEWGQPVALNTYGRACPTRAGYQARAERMTHTLATVLQAVPRNTELVVIEGMAYAAGGPDGHHLDPDVFGLWWHIFTHLHARGTAIAVIPPLTLKVWATGRAAEKVNGRMQRTDKADMLNAAREQFPDLKIHNADVADALHAGTCGATYLGHPVPIPHRRRDRYNVNAVAWPDLPRCPDCGHTSRDDQGHACMAAVERSGIRTYCGCTTLARPEHIRPVDPAGNRR